MSNLIKYRPEIDGLRTIAVLPVILFHIEHSWISGGYVGVDVFFAISGFLITSILLRELEENKYSIVKFYERRIRRLMPLALVVYVATLAFFSFVFPPDKFEQTALSTVSSLLFVSNIYFWQLGGYFGPSLETNPLLHTWSLSVEEQFYVFFPIFLAILFKISRTRVFLFSTLILVSLVSLALAVKFAPSQLSFAGFYLLPVRVYELMLGGMAALYLHKQSASQSARQFKYFSEIGLVLILTAMFTYNSSLAFPSYYALLPVIGSVLIFLDLSTNSPAKRILSSPFCVYLGKISYSLYLWHWPVVVAVKWMNSGFSTLVEGIIVVTITLLLSAFSYRYIETPFRNPQRFNQKKIFTLGISSMAALAGVAVVMAYIGNGKIVDPDGSIAARYKQSVSAEFNRQSCTNKMRDTMQFHSCFFDDTDDSKLTIFVWGDSHGSAMIPAFKQASADFNIEYVNNTGCPPILALDRDSNVHHCSKLNSMVVEHIKKGNYAAVVLIGAFNNYLNWALLRSSDTGDTNDQTALFDTHLGTTISELTPFVEHLIFVPQIPRFPYSVPEQVTKDAILNRQNQQYTLPLADYMEQQKEINQALSHHKELIIFDQTDLFCERNSCAAKNDDYLFYKDAHHISNLKAEAIGPEVKSFLMANICGDGCTP